MTGQHTPRGAFDSFQGLQVASNLGLNPRKGLPDNTQTSTHEGLHKGPKPGTRPKSKTTVKDLVDIKTSIKDSVDINDNTRLKQTMQDSDWPTRETSLVPSRLAEDGRWIFAFPLYLVRM
jgi:hypothetical protein